MSPGSASRVLVDREKRPFSLSWGKEHECHSMRMCDGVCTYLCIAWKNRSAVITYAQLCSYLGEDHGRDFLALRKHLCDICDVVMGDLRDVKKTGDSADIDEGAVGLDRSHNTLFQPDKRGGGRGRHHVRGMRGRGVIKKHPWLLACCDTVALTVLSRH